MTFFKGVKQGMHRFGDNLQLIVNSLLLTLVYLIGVGTTSLFARLSGKKLLALRLNKEAKTYWEDLDLKKLPKEEDYRPF